MTTINLPTELLQQIIGNFSIPTLRLGTTRPDSEDFKANRAALRNLCLASGLIQGIAQPLLYQTVIIYNDTPNSLHRLIRSLILRPDLRPLVKYVAFTPFVKEADCRSDMARDYLVGALELVRDIAGRDGGFLHAAGLSEEIEAIKHAHSCDMDSSAASVPNGMFASLLCLTPEVHTVLLEVVPGIHRSSITETFGSVFGARVLDGSDARLLPKLTTLQLQAHPQTNGNIRRLENVTIIDCVVLLRRPTLLRLETYQADGEQWPCAYPGGADYLSNIREMHLTTSMSIWKLQNVIERAVNLKKLTLLPDCYTSALEDEAFTDQCVDAAVASRAGTLEELRFQTFAIGGVQSISNEGRFQRLPELTKLGVLEIETAALFRSQSLLHELDLHELLPPNLTELRLRTSWYTGDPDPMSAEEYEAAMLRQFSNLAAARREMLPHLRTIRFWPRASTLNGEDESRGPSVGSLILQRVEETMRDVGIDFIPVDELVVHRDQGLHAFNEAYADGK